VRHLNVTLAMQIFLVVGNSAQFTVGKMRVTNDVSQRKQPNAFFHNAPSDHDIKEPVWNVQGQDFTEWWADTRWRCMGRGVERLYLTRGSVWIPS